MLNDLLNEELQEEQQEEFKITNLDGAIWAFRKMRAYMEKMKQINDAADGEIVRINLWRDKECESLQSSFLYFEGLIIEYYKNEKASDPKFKLSTPYGKVTSKKQPAKWIYEEEAVLEWARMTNFDYVRTKEELDKEALKKACVAKEGNVLDPSTGEVVPGITLLEQEEKISVKVEG